MIHQSYPAAYSKIQAIILGGLLAAIPGALLGFLGLITYLNGVQREFHFLYAQVNGLLAAVINIPIMVTLFSCAGIFLSLIILCIQKRR
jgi:hypothetical protein